MSLPRFGLLYAPLLLVACGGPDAPPAADPTGAVQRLELETLGEVAVLAPVEREVTNWPDLADDATIADWNFGGAKTSVISFGDSRVRTIDRGNPVRITIPAELRFANSPRLELLGIVRGEGFFAQAQLLKDGEVLARGKAPLLKSRGAQAFEFDFDYTPKVGGEELLCDTLVLELPPGKLPIGLIALKVEDLPIGGFLPPEAFGGLALIEQHADGRKGTLLSTDAGARSQFRVDRADQWLEFEYTIPNSVAPMISWPTLHVTLEVDGEVQREENIQPTTSWGNHGFSLEQFLHADVTATFEVRTEDGGQSLLALSQPKVVRKLSNPPTVLLITSDTHRADHVGFVSGPDGPRTELIDQLAEKGVSFLDTVASINNTTPSHVALFTGLPPRDTGIVSNAKRLAREAPTIADRFAELGYATIASVSAAPVCSEFSALDQGFDRYSNPGFRAARDGAETVQQLLEWLPDYEDEPLFVWLHLYDAHSPYDPPKDLLSLYYPEDLRPFDPASPVANLALAPDWDPTIADPVYTESLYKGEVSYVDARLAQLFERDRFWNGVVAFTADHGETLRTTEYFRFGHNALSHDNLAIPLVFVAPGLDGGEQRSTPVRQIDVGRTLLDLAGHPEVDFPGRNVLTADGGEGEQRFAIEANGYSAAVLSGKWMLRLGLRHNRSTLDQEGDWYHKAELFDVSQDGTGERDLSAENPEMTRELRAALVGWLGEGTRGRWVEAARGDAEAIARQLAELGYTGSEEAAEEEAPWFDASCTCAQCDAAR